MKAVNKTYFSNSNIVAFVISILSILLFLFLWINLNSLPAQNFEHQASEYIQSLRNVELTSYMMLITEIGDLWGYVIIISVLSFILIFKRRFDLIFQIVVIVISSSAINIILKALINRPRPFGEALVRVTFHSFPSGHAMSAMVFYGLMIYFLFKFINSLGTKLILTLVCVIMIFLIGISRIYLGVHYPTDVIAGYTAGLASLSVSVMLLNYFVFKTSKF